MAQIPNCMTEVRTSLVSEACTSRRGCLASTRCARPLGVLLLSGTRHAAYEGFVDQRVFFEFLPPANLDQLSVCRGSSEDTAFFLKRTLDLTPNFANERNPKGSSERNHDVARKLGVEVEVTFFHGHESSAFTGMTSGAGT